MTLLVAWLLADFLSGIIHWAEDKLLDRPSRFKLLNRIKEENDLHHAKPGLMATYTIWDNMRISVLLVAPLLLTSVLLGAPSAVSWAIFFLAFANLIHRFSHQPRAHIPPVVRFLQRIGLLISPSQHARHHADKKGLIRKENTTQVYCVLSGWLNPVLDGIRFFRFLDFVFGK